MVAATSANCFSMCPDSEVIFRRANAMVHVLETEEGLRRYTNMNLDDVHFGPPNSCLMIKEYHRSAAGRELYYVNMLRPISVLKQTLLHMMRIIREMKYERDWPLVYDFVFDRVRAVRQDIIIQRIKTLECIELLEINASFYLEALHRCELRKFPTYSRVLLKNQLKVCFAQWRDLFENRNSANERMILSYLIVNALNPSALLQLRVWRCSISPSNLIFVEKVMLSIRMNNYVRFFRSLESCDEDMLKYAMLLHAPYMRLFALRACVISHSCKNSGMPLKYLKETLKMADDSLSQALHEIGLEITNGRFLMSDSNIKSMTDIDLTLPHWL